MTDPTELRLVKTAAGVYELDVTRQICPFPEVYTVKVARRLPAGSRLKVHIADHCSLEDTVQSLKKDGFRVEMSESSGGVITLDITSAQDGNA